MNYIERLPDMEPALIIGAGFAEVPPDLDEPDSLALAVEHLDPGDEASAWYAYYVSIDAAAAMIAALYESAQRTGNITRLHAMVDQCRSLWREVPG